MDFTPMHEVLITLQERTVRLVEGVAKVSGQIFVDKGTVLPRAFFVDRDGGGESFPRADGQRQRCHAQR